MVSCRVRSEIIGVHLGTGICGGFHSADILNSYEIRLGYLLFAAVILVKYCRYGLTQYPINQSINQSIFYMYL